MAKVFLIPGTGQFRLFLLDAVGCEQDIHLEVVDERTNIFVQKGE